MAACGSSGPPVERIAVLPVENLSGDASLDWLSRAAQAMVTARLLGSKSVSPVKAEAIRDAHSARATTVLHSYFERKGQSIRVTATWERDRKTSRTDIAEGDLLSVVDRLARSIDPAARPFPSTNPAAIEQWGRGNFEAAVKSDPGFGPAYLNWVQSVSDRAIATRIATEAIAQPELRGAIERAQLELMLAGLREDLPARRKAFESLISLVPAEASPYQNLADMEFMNRNFKEAAIHYEAAYHRGREAKYLNSAGYARAMAGDVSGAISVLQRYLRAPGQETNAHDSLGEALFLNGRFAEAAPYFASAHDRNPQFLSGGDLYKAALSWRLAGDAKRAADHFAEYSAYRKGVNDPILDWRIAEWEYLNGREQDAIARLERFPHEVARAQLSIWRGEPPPGIYADLLAGRFAEVLPSIRTTYQRTMPASDGHLRLFYAWALIETGHEEDAKALLRLYPLPDSGDRMYRAIVFLKFIELRKRVGL